MPRILVILSSEPPRDGPRPPIVTRRELLDRLAPHNISPESPDAPDTLFGPGMRLELQPGEDPVTQITLTIVDEDIFFARRNGPLMRLKQVLPIRMTDMESGLEF